MPLSAWSNTLFSSHCAWPQAVNKSVITHAAVRVGLMEKPLAAETMDGGTEGHEAGTEGGGGNTR